MENSIINATTIQKIYDMCLALERERQLDYDSFNEAMNGVLKNGVLANSTDTLKVTPSTGMNISIDSGYCWINGKYGLNANAILKTLDNSDSTLNRIDRIVVRRDYSKTERNQISIEVLKGVLSANPVATALTRNELIYEMALADVLVSAGTTTITTAMITDQRANSTLCGWSGAYSSYEFDYDALDASKADKTTVNEYIGINTYNASTGGDANDIKTDCNRFVFNMANTYFEYGFLETKCFDGSGFAPSTSGVIMQTITKWNSSKRAIRLCQNNVWSTWKEVSDATYLQGKPISTTMPTESQMLKYISGAWTPKDSTKVVYGSGTITIDTYGTNYTTINLGFTCTAYLCVTYSSGNTTASSVGSGSSVVATTIGMDTFNYTYIAIRE